MKKGIIIALASVLLFAGVAFAAFHWSEIVTMKIIAPVLNGGGGSTETDMTVAWVTRLPAEAEQGKTYPFSFTVTNNEDSVQTVIVTMTKDEVTIGEVSRDGEAAIFGVNTFTLAAGTTTTFSGTVGVPANMPVTPAGENGAAWLGVDVVVN